MLDVFYVILGMFIGMFILYVKHDPKITTKHIPTIENSGKVTYIDNDGVCYKYKKKPVSCTKNNHS